MKLKIRENPNPNRKIMFESSLETLLRPDSEHVYGYQITCFTLYHSPIYVVSTNKAIAEKYGEEVAKLYRKYSKDNKKLELAIKKIHNKSYEKDFFIIPHKITDDEDLYLEIDKNTCAVLYGPEPFFIDIVGKQSVL